MLALSKQQCYNYANVSESVYYCNTQVAMAIIKYPGLLYTKVNMSYQYTQGAMVSIALFTDISTYKDDALGELIPHLVSYTMYKDLCPKN